MNSKYPIKQMTTISSISAILKNRICNGCGACSVVCPTACIDFIYGKRFNFPKINEDKCCNCRKCLEVCPSAFLLNGIAPEYQDDLTKKSFDCFLVHSDNNKLRVDAASGGFITGLIQHLMKNGLADGGVVTRCEGDNPIVAESFIAADIEEVFSARGSKYAPVSSCTALKKVLERPGRYVFVGTPCMVEGLTKLQKQLPKLKKRIVLTISFVCAGMASRLATRNYIENEGKVNLMDARRISYRGGGWPGRFRVFGKNSNLLMDRPLIGGSLEKVVGIDHYLRCENCLDHWAHFADITVSDPWTDEMVKNETCGWSAIMIRTERGKKAVNSAIKNGSLIPKSTTMSEMIGYNKHLFIDSKHNRHSWMALFQLLFLKRKKFMLPLLLRLLKGKLVGARTTTIALLKKEYYY